MKLSDTFILLQQEGYLIRSCLTHGLTAFRSARVDTKGDFYVAFFQLSIGLERIMKANVIISHMANNNFRPPTKAELKVYGHDLISLFEALRHLPVADTASLLDNVVKETVEYDILTCLSDFAKTTRYFNLDSLAAIQTCKDPLAAWNAVIERILREDIAKRHKTRIAKESEAYASMMQAGVVVIAHDLEKKEMDLAAAYSLPRMQDLAAAHAVYHACRIIRSLSEQLSTITYHAMDLARKAGRKQSPIPFMNEFFHFMPADKSQILRKKNWT